jgi:serine/threonine-protein kinase
LREGQVLNGKFRVERIIGEGAMGLVVQATHLGLDERVALKFLRREAMSQPEVVARFAREARASVKLKSDHVARVFDVGTTEDGTPFIVMEFLVGSDLGAVLAQRGQLDIPEAVEYIIQACEGLTEAHARGIVHRDVKPENLFLAQGAGALKQVKVLDFGISKAALTAGSLDVDLASQHTTQIMGSPHYMSPDQLRSTRDVDGRADIWSLGVVLFELLAGSTPFNGTDMTGLIAQILHEPHERLRTLRAEVPPELEAIVDKCLSKDPAMRYQSAADVAVALLPFAPKRARASVERAADIARSAGGTAMLAEIDSIPPPAMSGRPSGPRPSPRQNSETALGTAMPIAPNEPVRRSPAVWIVAGIVVLLAVGAAALAMTTRGTNQAATTPTASISTATGIASPPVSGTAAPTAASAPTPAESAPIQAPAPSAEPSHTISPARIPTPPARTARPPTTAAPTRPPVPGAPRQPESEIRMER